MVWNNTEKSDKIKSLITSLPNDSAISLLFQPAYQDQTKH